MENTTNQPLMPLEKVLTAICNANRWRLLAILADGQGYGVKDLADLLGITYPATFQNVLLLREAGIIVMGRGRLYRIAPQYQPEPGKPVLEFGHCLLRLNAVAPA